jgi:hypothetical protein
MAWVPIQDSDVAFTFTPSNSSVTMTGSVISADGTDGGASFTLTMDQDNVTFRITIQSYAANTEGMGITDLPFFQWPDQEGGEIVENTAADPEVAFEPSPIEGSVALEGGAIFYTSASGFEWSIFETYEFLMEVEEPDPPDLGEVYVIRNTLRAYQGGDNPQEVWVRTEAGKLDMSNVDSLTVDILRGTLKLLTLNATSPEVGKVEFTIAEDNIHSRLSLGGLFRVLVRADGRVIATGLLEVL